MLVEELRKGANRKRFEAEEAKLEIANGRGILRRRAEKLAREAKELDDKAAHINREASKQLQEALSKAKPRGIGRESAREVSVTKLKEW